VYLQGEKYGWSFEEVMHTFTPSDHVSVELFTYRTQASGISNLGYSPSEIVGRRVNATLGTLIPAAGSCPRERRQEEAWELA
jgi:hypothetical protein